MLQNSGASLLAMHPRTRTQREEVMADWTQIRHVKSKLKIPVIANGDCWHAEDAWLCMCQTGADGVMSAQGLLQNPALFEPLALANKTLPSPSYEMAPSLDTSLSRHLRRRRALSAFNTVSLATSFKSGRGGGGTNFSLPKCVKGSGRSSFLSTPQDLETRFCLAEEYLECCAASPPCDGSIIRRHLFFILFDSFHANLDLYDDLFESNTNSRWKMIVETLRERAKLGEPHPAAKGRLLNKKRTFRRDGTLAPPPWPVGGGGFNVSKKNNSGEDLKKTGKKKRRKKKKREIEEGQQETLKKKKKKLNLDVFGNEDEDGAMPSVGLF